MLESLNLDHILFLDIETVPAYPVYDKAPEKWQKLWDQKAKFFRDRNEEDTPASVYDRAGIYAEFGKIVCISVGAIKKNGGFHLRSFADHDEKKLLADFAALLHERYNGPLHRLCAHNGKEFDYPYIARRMVVHGIKLPQLLDITGKKPWEINLLDTMEMWKFGDYKSYTSISLLAALFDIPTPKDDINGSQVYGVYYNENDLARIVVYCQKDVLTVAQLLRRYRGEPLIPEELVTIST
ncbi:MAG: DNA polymerase elongation subunit [Bacteroidetes bacterium]|nr:MAG: DNA polymerase elongation subunit [Bacteroidota bacterium]